MENIGKRRSWNLFKVKTKCVGVVASVLALVAANDVAAQANVGSWRGAVCVVDVANNDVLWLRAKPNAKARKVGSLPPDNCEETLTYAYFDGRRKGGWIQVQTTGGKTGWANERFLVPFPAWDAGT